MSNFPQDSIFNNSSYNLTYPRGNPNPFTLSTPNFSLPYTPPQIPLIIPAAPAFDGPGFGLISGTFKAGLNEADIPIPPALKALGLVASAAKTGKELSANIQVALDQGQSPAEAAVCQTTRTVVEKLAGDAMKGAIVGGIPAYLTAAAANPPLALTVPFVLPVIPTAYQGAQVATKVAGNASEALCHRGFEAARDLTRKGH